MWHENQVTILLSISYAQSVEYKLCIEYVWLEEIRDTKEQKYAAQCQYERLGPISSPCM